MYIRTGGAMLAVRRSSRNPWDASLFINKPQRGGRIWTMVWTPVNDRSRTPAPDRCQSNGTNIRRPSGACGISIAAFPRVPLRPPPADSAPPVATTVCPFGASNSPRSSCRGQARPPIARPPSTLPDHDDLTYPPPPVCSIFSLSLMYPVMSLTTSSYSARWMRFDSKSIFTS